MSSHAFEHKDISKSQRFFNIIQVNYISLKVVRVKPDINKSIQYSLPKFQWIDKLFQVTYINKLSLISLSAALLKQRVVTSMQTTQQSDHDMVANISSQLCSVECGDIFYATQTTSGIETSNCGDTNIFLFLQCDNAVSKKNEKKNQLYCFRACMLNLFTYWPSFGGRHILGCKTFAQIVGVQPWDRKFC